MRGRGTVTQNKEKNTVQQLKCVGQSGTALRRQKQADLCVFYANLVYIMRFRLARTT